jgi:hypothetical protein
MRYPQVDIRSYDPHVSPALADLVTGSFSFIDLPHELRVFRLHALIELLGAVQNIGELEHTADWDWRIEVIHAHPGLPGQPPEIAGTHGEDWWTDEMGLPYRIESHDYLDHFARWKNLRLTEYHIESDEPKEITIPIDHIRVINIYLEG